MGCAYGVDISSVLWKDNKSVRLASTYVGIESYFQLEKIQRVFSQVYLIKNDKRNALHTETVNAILMAKAMLCQQNADKWITSDKLLSKYKKEA